MTIIDEVSPKTSTQRKTKNSELAANKDSNTFISVIYYPNSMSPPKTHLSSLTFSGLGTHRITLNPGTNLLKFDQLQFLESHEAFQQALSLNAAVIMRPNDKDVDIPDSLMAHNLKDALEIIAHCNGSHMPQLRMWLQTSRRSQIQNALSKKINQLSGG